MLSLDDKNLVLSQCNQTFNTSLFLYTYGIETLRDRILVESEVIFQLLPLPPATVLVPTLGSLFRGPRL